MIPNRISHHFHNLFRDNEAKIHELNYLFWECTQRCNLKCLHCGSDCSTDSKHGDMPFDDFLRAILPLKDKYKADSITVVITGGEPLLREDLALCGKNLREHGFRWGIVTNGYAYTRDIHARLIGAGLGAITVSLDGLEESHNWLRSNKNSFNRAMQALDLIASSDRLCYDVVTCVNSKNIEELPVLLKIFTSRKIKAWRLFTIAPIGRAKNNQELQLSDRQLTWLFDFISQARKENKIDIKFSCEAYVGVYEKKVRDSFFFCRAGINIGSILIDGSISACPNIDRHLAQGNIYSDNFLDVWENKFVLMRNRSWAKSADCKECKDYRNCNGGAMHMRNKELELIGTCINKRITNYHEAN